MASFGEILKRERELRGISLREISAATKISTRHLEALEQSEIGSLPGGLFNKGFIRAYALHVGIDPDEMVNNYLYDVGQMEAEDPLDAMRAMVPPAHRGAAGHWRQAGIVGAILGGGVVLFVVLSQAFRSTDSTDRPSAPAAPADPPVAAVAGQPGPDGGDTAPPAESAAPLIPDTDPGDNRDHGRSDDPSPDPGNDRASPPETEADRPPAPSPRVATMSPPGSTRSPVPLPPAATPATTDWQFELEMRHAARIRIVCDGNEVLNKRLTAGERRRFTCRNLEFSTSDSASFRYRINDDGWVIPGPPGRRLDGVRLTPSGGDIG